MFDDDILGKKDEENRLSTPELNDAVRNAKKKYFESLTVGSDAEDDGSNSEVFESIESSEMSEFEPDEPDKSKMRQRVKKDIKKSIERFQRTKSNNVDEAATTPSPKKKKRRKRI